ncbi:YpuI family protein [Paenibacillus sp. 1001270B_150601_E10]|uniref:YpuI family protein n=1 Tax=Paenibacillus sp. 1001270B_150601_E10 TaxID=2787079 RepID=UPI00189FE62E|nr:YpuI family protein [Paenibacillus sp. 1001270B_150601_E10]
MPASNAKQLCEVSREKLKYVNEKLELFLNAHTLPELVQDVNEEETVSFYKGFLSDLRHLLVFSEVSYEKLGVTLRRAKFDADFAERALYDVYHQVVNAYFYPKNECYSEDGRYAYTGQDAIRFRMKPIRSVRDIILDINKIFEELRDELSYYESDYLTQRKMQGTK